MPSTGSPLRQNRRGRLGLAASSPRVGKRFTFFPDCPMGDRARHDAPG